MMKKIKGEITTGVLLKKEPTMVENGDKRK
jgi:hypothetical protein